MPAATHMRHSCFASFRSQHTVLSRSSPFFWAFQQGLVGDIDIAGAIFAFTDSIPGAKVGQAVQTVNLAAGSLVSEVKLSVFPGLSGTVVTQCRASGVLRFDFNLHTRAHSCRVHVHAGQSVCSLHIGSSALCV